MKYLSLAASLIACAATAAAQSTTEPCTYTTRSCFSRVATATVTDYEIPGTVTVTQSFDCHGCQAIVTQNICGPGPVVPVTTTTVYAEETTTESVCSPTPAV